VIIGPNQCEEGVRGAPARQSSQDPPKPRPCPFDAPLATLVAAADPTWRIHDTDDGTEQAVSRREAALFLLQVVDVVKDNMGLPDWVFPSALILLLIGLPIMLGTAIIQGRPTAPDSGPTESSPAVPAARPEADLSPRRFFTWRNALIGGAAAFVLLTVFTAGFMFMRTRGIGPVGSLVARGVLDERGKVILADFEASDPEIARAVTEAFRVDLAQSTIVTLVEPASIEDALQRMGRPTGEPLDEQTARELGVRDGVPAVIAGELSSVGRGFVLSARLVDSNDGAVLASARASARDSSSVLDAIDIVSSKLRERIGESYTSVRASPPLAHVTTSSLEALRKYTQAQDARNKEGNAEAAIALLEEAVAIDTAFALAHRDLATILGNMRRNWDRQVQALESAFRHRDRLTERERYRARALPGRGFVQPGRAGRPGSNDPGLREHAAPRSGRRAGPQQHRIQLLAAGRLRAGRRLLPAR